MVSNPVERRSEPRRKPDNFCYVEFKPADESHIYQFRIWDLSFKGMCLLVRADSDILNRLKIDDVLEMTYYPEDSHQPPQILKTQIRHITLEKEGRFKGHYLMGLLILESRGQLDKE